MTFLQEVDNYFSLLATPSQTFHSLRVAPRLKVAIFFPAVVFGLVLLPTYHAYRQVFSNIYAQRFGEDTAPMLLRKVMGLPIVLTLLVDGVYIPIRWLFVSSVVFAATRRQFKQIVTCVVTTELVLALMGVINVLLIYASDLEKATSLVDLFKIPSMTVLLNSPEKNRAVFFLASSINPFSTWYVFLIAYGLKTMFDTPMMKASLLSLTAWLLWSSFTILIPYVQSLFLRV